MKQTYLKKYRYISLVVLGILMGSCSDDFLDFQPIAAENSASFYLTMAQAEQAVTAAYSLLASRTA